MINYIHLAVVQLRQTFRFFKTLRQMSSGLCDLISFFLAHLSNCLRLAFLIYKG